MLKKLFVTAAIAGAVTMGAALPASADAGPAASETGATAYSGGWSWWTGGWSWWSGGWSWWSADGLTETSIAIAEDIVSAIE
ncbi:hypothetical protein [Nocardiopsis composta]|uniref:hypothetical protein n=1 Tax=Nocardiopsis composta TaxID=157465 RepID=UPI00160F2F1F|nr:hypothetical protein [Nocardiopsis composta]